MYSFLSPMTIFTLSPSLSHTPLLSQSFMQHPKKSRSRKPWYRRAIEMSRLWKAVEIPIKNVTLWKTREKLDETRNTSRKLRKSSSTRVASSFTRVCLCAPISSYTDIFRTDAISPRRSYSYSRSTSLTSRRREIRTNIMGVQGRKIFRGKSLTDDVLMRRFVIEEAMMQVRRRNEMNIIRRRSGIRKKKIGPSLLSRMSLAEEY